MHADDLTARDLFRDEVHLHVARLADAYFVLMPQLQHYVLFGQRARLAYAASPFCSYHACITSENVVERAARHCFLKAC